MKIKDICKNSDLKKVTTDETILSAAQIMKKHDIGALPVFRRGKPIGFVTDRDIALRSTAKNQSADDHRVSEIMSEGAVTISEDGPLEEAAETMRKNNVRRLLVVDKQNNPKGILGLDDLATKTNDPNFAQSTMASL